VPRWGGDTNYMTTVCQMRVIPEWLDEMYAQLRPLFDRMSAEMGE
ncbi:MAG: HIT family hydrolase, partial [Chloroflexi bacterium]|nr:HIT family hydrolase [Chloroflexota bacterium]